MNATAFPTVSAVIPCRNEAQHIERLLEALTRQDLSGFEIVLVDGRSTDGTPEAIRRYADAHPALDLKLISNPGVSIPSGLNLGIAQATGEIIVRLDGHSRPASNYLRRCLDVLTQSGAAVVGGAWEIKPGAPGLIAEAIALAVSSPLGAGDAHYRLSSASQPRDVDTVPFGCFHRQTWQAVGGYNESLLSNEDYEFNLRVRLMGERVRFDPRIRCEYFARPTISALARQYWRYGWWKAQMLRAYPGSLRARQAVPLLWAGSGLLLLLLAFFVPVLRPLTILLWSVYAAVVTFWAAWASLRRRWTLWPWLVAVYTVIHFSWGLGAWAGLLFAGIGSGTAPSTSPGLKPER